MLKNGDPCWKATPQIVTSPHCWKFSAAEARVLELESTIAEKVCKSLAYLRYASC